MLTRRAALAGLTAGAACAAQGWARSQRPARPAFRATLSIGTDLEQVLSKGIRFQAGSRRAGSLEELQALYGEYGANEVYARIGTRVAAGNGLAAALVRARLAKTLGMALSPEVGLWETYGGQPDFSDYPDLRPPRAWHELGLEEMERTAEHFGRRIADRVLDTGVAVTSWQLSGDERGIGGLSLPFSGPFLRPSTYRAPDRVDPAIGAIDPLTFHQRPVAERIAWYQRHLWPYTGRVLGALARGIRDIQRDARFSTHVGSSPTPAYEPTLMRAFFEATDGAGYRVDELGICYFPSSIDAPADRWAAFQQSVADVCGALRRPMYVAEYAYPVGAVHLGTAESELADWSHETPGYPLSTGGQADLLAALLRWGRGGGYLSGVRPWAPDAVFGPWAPLSLFDLAGSTAQARPALDAFAHAARGA